MKIAVFASTATGPARLSAQLFTKGPYSLARRAYAAALVDEAENSAHVRHVIDRKSTR